MGTVLHGATGVTGGGTGADGMVGSTGDVRGIVSSSSLSSLLEEEEDVLEASVSARKGCMTVCLDFGLARTMGTKRRVENGNSMGVGGGIRKETTGGDQHSLTYVDTKK